MDGVPDKTGDLEGLLLEYLSNELPPKSPKAAIERNQRIMSLLLDFETFFRKDMWQLSLCFSLSEGKNIDNIQALCLRIAEKANLYLRRRRDVGTDFIFIKKPGCSNISVSLEVADVENLASYRFSIKVK